VSDRDRHSVLADARGLVATALIAALLVVGGYVAAGGGGYEPLAVRDPCVPRPWPQAPGLDRTAEQFALSALDGAACRLRVTRETLALAVADDQSLARFRHDYRVDDQRLQAALRAGLVRAIDDGQRAGAIPGPAATVLRQLVSRLPAEQAIALFRDARQLFRRLSELAEGGVGAAAELLRQGSELFGN
jgi:hypothetical protein